jgi:hypothetical protein
LLLLLAGLMALASTAVQAQQRSPQAAPGNRRVPTAREAESPPVPGARPGQLSRRSVTFTPEREAAALAFLRLNRPELLPVLEDLQSSKPDEYQRAICDFFWTSETLAAIRQDDARLHELSLRTWQLEAQTHLLASQLAGQPADARLRAELQQAVEELVDAQLAASAHEVRRLEAQFRRAQDRHHRQAARRDELVRQRYDALSQAIEQSGQTQGENP